MLVNNSRLATYLECPRKYFWSYVFLGSGLVRKLINENLAFGTIVHHLLALYYADRDWRAGLGDALRAAVPDYDTFPDMEKTLWQEKLEWAERLVGEYVKWAGGVDKFSILDIEAEGTVLLGKCCHQCGRTYSGVEDICTCGAEAHYIAYKTDLTVNQSGAVFPIDHKTTSGIGDNYLASWNYSSQMHLYGKGTQALHPTTNRFQMNLLRKAKRVGQMVKKQCKGCHNGSVKKLTCPDCKGEGKVDVPAVSPPPFHRPPPTIILPEVMDRVEISRISACNRIAAEESAAIDDDPLTTWDMRPDHCFNMGRCPFIDLCWSKAPADQWHYPTEETLSGYLPRPKDYVTLAREEET